MSDKNKMGHRLIVPLFALLLITSNSYAANWLLLQGTEPNSASEQAKLWGFIQGQYQKDFSDSSSTGLYIPSKLIGPNLESQSQLNVNRARMGIRGVGFPIDSRMNYLILGEFGNNGITQGKGAKLTDASFTLNWIPFLRIRGGLFKYPGSEEGLQAIHVADYINFSAVTNQLMLERFPNRDNYLKTVNGRGNTEAQRLGTPPNGFSGPTGAFRDVGIQLFDAFTLGQWETSYAIMAGNGNGLNLGDNNSNITMHYYLAEEWLLGGNGARRDGVKLYLWYQTGDRNFDLDFTNSVQGVGTSSQVVSTASFNRTRMGTGLKALYGDFRLAAEFLKGEGMIFLGPHKESFDINEPGAGTPGDGLYGKGRGWYVDGGWRILKSNFELDVRYDMYNRLVGDPLEVQYSNITFGLQYFLNKKTRFTLNYEIRKAKSVLINPALEDHLSTIGDRLSFQVTAIY